MVAAAVPELQRLRQYLEARAPRVERRGAVLASGLEALDRLLEGGFPKGGMTVLTGSLGAGRTTLAARLVATETRAGRPAAWIDASGTLYPPALSLAGVELGRVLMVRGVGERGYYATEQIIASGGFGVVVASGLDGWISAARLRRIQTATEGTRTATVLVLDPRAAAEVQSADLKLSLTRKAAGIQVEVEKHRLGGLGRRALIAAV